LLQKGNPVNTVMTSWNNGGQWNSPWTGGPQGQFPVQNGLGLPTGAQWTQGSWNGANSLAVDAQGNPLINVRNTMRTN